MYIPASFKPRIITMLIAALIPLTAGAATFTITSDYADNQLRDNGSIPWAGNGSIRVGGDSGTTDSCGMFPFALPEIPEGEFILSVNFRFYMSGVGNSPGPVDAYVLPYSSTTSWTVDDFYQGAYDGDPNATALQDDILVVESPAGHYLFNDIAAEALKQHIIDQYDAGAVAGDFVTLRLSPSRTNETNYYFYNVSTSNNETVENRPTLTIETFDGNYPPEVGLVPLQSVNVGSSIDFTVSATDANQDDELSFSSVDLPDFAELVDNEDGTATITLTPQSGDAGLYSFTVTADDGAKQGSGSVSVVVIDPNVSIGVPSFGSVDPISISQGENANVNLTVTDSDDTTTTITAVNLPDFATFQDNGDMTASVTIETWYDDPHGDYTIYVIAEDDDGNTGVIEISLHLEEVVFAPGYYCDPVNGDISNDGSPQRPWPSLQQVMAVNKVFEPGDTIYLRDGYHGEPTINGSNSDYVYIKPAEGQSPTLAKLNFGANAKYWHVSDLSISRSHAPSYSRSSMVGINGTYNVVSNCQIFSVPDISAWEASDWTSLASNGVGMNGQYNTLEDCTVMNTSFAVQTGTSSSFLTIRNNHIQNFSGDGIRALGNDQLVEYNYIADNYNVDDNHDDGVQGWSVSATGGSGTGVTSRITLRGNFIIETTDPDRPLQGPLQGIGCFDGMFEEWVVENNMIIVNQWHGIALYGAINCRIVNNTVLDQDMDRSPGPTWITIEPHKNWSGTSNPTQKAYYYGTGNVVSNNLTTRINAPVFGRLVVNPDNETVENNIQLKASDFADYFVDYPNDLRLKPGSPAIDAGVTANAPSIDIYLDDRPKGLGIDVGAHEFEPELWASFEVVAGSWINTVNFMGWINIAHEPWIWQTPSNSWFHFNEQAVSEQGAWVYSAAMVPGSASSGNVWAGYSVNSNGWVESPIGAIYVNNGNWVYVNALRSWCFLPESLISASGSWIYAANSNR